MYTYDWNIQQVKVQHLSDCDVKKCSATGNRTPVSRVTGGDTHHYTIVESSNRPRVLIIFQNFCFKFLSACFQFDVEK